MPYRLEFELDGRRFRANLKEAETLLVGSATDCGLRLPFPGISRHHAVFRVEQGLLWVEDQGARNGTWLDGQRLSEPTRLCAASRLRLGDVVVVVEPVAADDASLAVSFQAGLPGTGAAEHATLATGFGAPFLLESLPDLLALLASRPQRFELAQRLGPAAANDLQLRGLEVLEREPGKPAALLFCCGELDPETAVQAEAGSLRLRLSAGSGVSPSQAAGLARTLLQLLLLAEPQSCAAETPQPPATADAQRFDPAMREIYRRAQRVAGSTLNVLIRGESGTGKEVLAQYLRSHSHDPDASFVAVNCAALPRDLIDAELFGIERGVATGVESRAGKFEQAHGGILFLDEIGDMAPETQARMLRALQEGEVTRIGGSRSRPAQVRVIAATNQDLETRLADGRFRRDLFYRIADWQVCLPPLRERIGDILPLASHFLDAACRERGVALRGITRAAANALLAYAWPGNVRELAREMARAAVFLSDGDSLAQSDLQAPIQASTVPTSDLKSQLEAAERRILKLAMHQAGGNLSQVAERLGVARSTLYRRLDALGLEPEA